MSNEYKPRTATEYLVGILVLISFACFMTALTLLLYRFGGGIAAFSGVALVFLALAFLIHRGANPDTQPDTNTEVAPDTLLGHPIKYADKELHPLKNPSNQPAVFGKFEDLGKDANERRGSIFQCADCGKDLTFLTATCDGEDLLCNGCKRERNA